MKRIYFLLLTVIICLSGCNKFEPTPVDTTDKRINETLDRYNSILADAEFGWKAYLLTNTDVAVDFTFKFDGKNRVSMNAEFDNQRSESSYRVKALQRPTLLFDTYSTLHKLSDPTPSVLGGALGEGYAADFEFAIVSATTDKVVLEGTFNKSQLVLVKAKSQNEIDETYNNTGTMLEKMAKVRTYFKRTVINGGDYELKIDNGNRKIDFIQYIDGVRKTTSGNFFVVDNDLNFFEPIVLGKDSLSSLDEITYDAAAGYIKCKLGTQELKISEANEPLFYDKTAVSRFWQADRQLSFTPWVMDNVVDYLNDASITAGTGVNQRIAWLGYDEDLDLIAYGANFSLRYGIGITPTIDKSSGMLKYDVYGILGTLPTVYRNIIIQTALNFTDPKGLYVIETGANTFDLVTATDARRWISLGPL
ncbi:DUF4302 domain-containing protein [Sphingobacterium puteale]|uniref:DUF4302 domain-containing protein n=1 Tax=Sphingobacterium puteale TaxID=2420510 RepID=UPI003D963EBF